MSLQKNIRDLIFFYVKTNYNKYLEERNLKFIPDNEVDQVINTLYGDRKEHIQVFIKASLKQLYESKSDEYPGDLVVLNILVDIFSDDNLCKNRLIIEIRLHQQQIKDGKNELYIVNDKLGSPTYTNDFAENVKLLIEKGKQGLFNMVGGGFTNRIEVTIELVKLLNLQDKIKIIEVNSSFFEKEYFADRPRCECLINKRLNNLKLNIMQNWKVALDDYINNHFNKNLY